MTNHDDLELKRALDALPRSIHPPEDLWPSVRGRLAPRPARGTARRPDWSAAFRPRTLRLAAGIAAIGVGLAVLAAVTRARATWQVSQVAGAPHLGGATMQGRRSFPVGAVLLTDARSRALVRVGTIGEIEVEANTHLRLLTANVTEHRLALERGRIHARISAPPRLFFVETPSATAVDLGCAYTLEVDEAGNSLIHVTLGWVSFERGGHESLVPAGMRAVTRAGGRIGTPFADDAPETLRLALAAFDFAGGGDTALATVLREARVRDAITLWHLLARSAGAQREAVYDRLAALVPPPPGVTRDGALRLDGVMLRLYWEQLPLSLPITPEWTKTLWRWWLRLTSW